MKPKFFKKPADLRKWFEQNHETIEELWVGYHKKATGKPSITWPESVDQALCFGWIDGIRKSVDEHSYMIRFTPRRPKSVWSAINIKKVKELTEKGLMHPNGSAAFDKKEDHRSGIYSFEQDKKNLKLPPDYEKQFKANKKAWAFYQSMPPSYRRTSAHWVISAKQEATRLKRLQTLITDSEEGIKIKPLRR